MRATNVLNWIDQDVVEELVARRVNERVDQKGALELKSKHGTKSFIVTQNKLEKSIENLLKMKNSAKLTSNQTEKISTAIRDNFGKKAIEPYSRKYLQDQNKQFEDLFPAQQQKQNPAKTQSSIAQIFMPSLNVFAKRKEVFPEAEEWPEQLHLLKEPYFQGFEGNECHRLLNRLDQLKKLIAAHEVDDQAVENIVRALETFQALVHSCFGTKLKDNWESCLTNFKEAYNATKLSKTPKVHIIVSHLEEFIHSTHSSLGLYSEQSHEGYHSRFHHFWQKYLVKDITKDICAKNLLKCVHDINGNHA